MKVIFVLYIILWIIIGLIAIVTAKDTDENGEYKTPWFLIINIIMFLFIPIVAKYTGII